MHDPPDTPEPDSPHGPWPWGGPPDAEPVAEPEAAEAAAEPTSPSAPISPMERKLWAVSCHLSPLLFTMVGVPFLGALGPLIVWQMKRDDLEEVDDQGREALNFQLNVLFWTGILLITCIGAVMIPVLHVVALVFGTVATVKTFDGERYRYPGILRVVREPATIDDLADAADAAGAAGAAGTAGPAGSAQPAGADE